MTQFITKSVTMNCLLKHLIVFCIFLTVTFSFSIQFTKTDCNVSNKAGTSDPYCFITNGSLNIGLKINKDIKKAYVRIFQENVT